MRRALLVLIAAVFVAPGVFVVWRAAQLGGSIRETAAELSGPAWRTAQLAVLVGASSAILGTLLAWLVTCTNLPGRAAWKVLLVLPIALPSFVGTTAVLAGFTPGGALANLWEFFGFDRPRRIRGLFPSWLLLTAFSYPFVMLPVAARLRSLRPSLDEAARLLGCTGWRLFRRITLPQIRAAVTGGTLIVILYMLSEFGAVQLLGYDTLTRVIFATRQIDRATSFLAAAMLFLTSIAVVVVVRAARGDQRVDDVVAARTGQPTRLGWWTPIALCVCSIAMVVGLAAPLMSLIGWAVDGVRVGRVHTDTLATATVNTAFVAVVAAIAAVLVVLPVASASVRRGDRVARGAAVVVVGGFALPGLVVALALAILVLNTPGLGVLYQTVPMLILAYVIHFGSQALASAEGAVRGISRSVLESSRLLEPVWWRRVARVEAPLMRSGLLSGGGLVMLAVIKELPATLLLSPIGFRTLSTEVWSSFEEGFLADAAVGTLVLLLVSGTLTWVLVLRDRRSITS